MKGLALRGQVVLFDDRTVVDGLGRVKDTLTQAGVPFRELAEIEAQLDEAVRGAKAGRGRRGTGGTPRTGPARRKAG